VSHPDTVRQVNEARIRKAYLVDPREREIRFDDGRRFELRRWGMAYELPDGRRESAKLWYYADVNTGQPTDECRRDIDGIRELWLNRWEKL
jgi:hypothetical protein